MLLLAVWEFKGLKCSILECQIYCCSQDDIIRGCMYLYDTIAILCASKWVVSVSVLICEDLLCKCHYLNTRIIKTEVRFFMKIWIKVNICTLGASHFTRLWLPKVSCCIAATIIRTRVFGPAITEAKLKYLNPVSCGYEKDWDIKQTMEHTLITGNLTWQWNNRYGKMSDSSDSFKRNSYFMVWGAKLISIAG